MATFKKLIERKTITLLSLLMNFALLAYIGTKYSKPCNGFSARGTNTPNVVPFLENFDQLERLQADDLSGNLLSIKDFNDEIYEWDVCKSIKKKIPMNLISTSANSTPIYKAVKYCEFRALSEQHFQFQFFKRYSPSCTLRQFACVLLPPKSYQWLSKFVNFPALQNEAAVPWANLGLDSWEDLIQFNPGHPKNMIHFNASYYDILHEGKINVAAQYIPFGKKIRSMLEIGAGGGSVSFILKKRYDVTVLNTALPDFPYCEYITERGGLCAFLDGEKVLPFAKFSFDVVHHSWVYHGLTPARWRDVLLEQNRILRPGGYLWISDGLSYAQLETIKYLLLHQLGYKILYEDEIKRESITVNFGLNPYEVTWESILVKPNTLKNDLSQCQ
ncbi:unnamed protein product [Rotaria magnacalcarata]|uniref:Methyltransferase type 11 domain-containing protein n=5 Tax=Rotaria magnacalcarata TaxID=392030 RepID=A0A819ZQY8_9BILA|nr:unnamed protein product [Rotaria magnacalcarata]CAF4052884.1 unnamed protein product [Rotaria magnacalcarata]CAF4177864.1 unnamed protein product [Rotaria magnacalcarata]CAF4416786.1 unnamed protein product [Rotaria magnacalcarata]